MAYYNIATAILAFFFEDLNVLPAVFSYFFTIAYPIIHSHHPILSSLNMKLNFE